MKINAKWWRRIYPATKTDVSWYYETVMSELNQIACQLDQKLDQTANKLDHKLNQIAGNLDHVKYLVIVNNAIHTTFLSADLQKQIRFLLQLLRPVKIDEFNKIRVGSEFDGGYVQLDDYERLSLALSLGIGANDDWDLATARKGIRTPLSVGLQPLAHSRRLSCLDGDWHPRRSEDDGHPRHKLVRSDCRISN